MLTLVKVFQRCLPNIKMGANLEVICLVLSVSAGNMVVYKNCLIQELVSMLSFLVLDLI